MPQNATPSSHTKSGRETDRKEISLKEEHIRLHHLDTHAYSLPISGAAVGYSVRYNRPTDPTVCLSLHFEHACCTTNKANGSKVQSITGWCLNVISTNRYLEQRLAPRLPPHRKQLETLPPASTLYPKGGFSLSCLHCTDHICKPPTLFPVGQKTGYPPPPLFSKKPPPTGLAGYNGPPKECLPLHALSPPPIAEQREGRRAYIPLCSVPSLAVYLTDWFVV